MPRGPLWGFRGLHLTTKNKMITSDQLRDVAEREQALRGYL